MRILLVGTELEHVAAALSDRYDVVRAETLEAVRSALPGAAAVVVEDLPDATAAAVLNTVRSGVYAPAETPVVRLDGDPEAAVVEGFDAVVSPDSPSDLHAALEVAENADTYRDAVTDLFEACQARASGDADVDLADAFERADRAFTELHESAGRTPYGRIFGFREGSASAPTDTGREGDATENADAEEDDGTGSD